MIEANLLANYTNDQIEAFYGTFKDKMDGYSKLNPEAMDTLWSFVDFETFKKNNLMAKNFLNQDFDKNNRTELEAVSDIN